MVRASDLETGIGEDGALKMWPLLEILGIKEAYSKINDASLGWINNNRPLVIDRMIPNKKFRLVSKFKAWKKYVCKADTAYVPLGTVEDFYKGLETVIPLWRGGSGTFDPNWTDNRAWTSFTGKKSTVNTFSVYNGTNSSKAFMLAKNKEFWVIQLDIKLADILLYLDAGFDEEFIIPSKLVSQAKLIATHETNSDQKPIT